MALFTMCHINVAFLHCAAHTTIRVPRRVIIVLLMSLNVVPIAHGESGAVPPLSSAMTFRTLDGHPVTVSTMQHSVILLNFWGTWCGPCLDEIPDLITLSHRFQSHGLRVIGVTLASGSSEDIQAFTKAHGMDYTVVIGDLDAVKTTFHVMGFPASVLLDRKGVIRKRYFGPQTEAGLTRDILPLLSSSFTDE